MNLSHRPVLLESAVNALLDPSFSGRRAKKTATAVTPSTRLQGVYVDGTFGRGGHSRQLLSQLDSGARLLVFDKDPEAIAQARQLAEQDKRVQVVHDSFAALERHLDEFRLGQVDGVLLDLGISSPQVDDASRGFSFMRDGPLDMRMDTTRGLTAAQWLAQASQEEIKEVIAHYGEERFAFQIAAAIVNRRESRPLQTTHDLAELVATVVRTREKGQHPATRTFQALRIHLNEELAQLAHGLAAILKRLAPGGRLAVISFHSLEDRIVKQFIAQAAKPGQAQARLPVPEKDMPQPVLTALGRVFPSAEEIAANPRARSAVLRVAQRTDAPLLSDALAHWLETAVPKPGQEQRHRRRGAWHG